MKPSPISAIPQFDADEIRRIVARGKQAGLIIPAAPATAAHQTDAPLPKPGEALATAGTMRSVWMDITPELAARWLKHNFVNRPLAEDVLQAYARDMINGVWVPTHQGIAFNDSDALIDGQHRLTAIVRTGRTIRMMVTYGLPAKIAGHEMTTMDAVDRGRPRSVADQLRIQHGMVNGSIIASVCASLAGVCFGERTRRLSVGQTLQIYREFESGVDFAIERRPKTHGLRAAGVLAAFAFAHATGRTAEVESCFKDLVAGNGAARSPILALHAFLTSPDARLLTRGADRALAELVLQALYLELLGARVDKLSHGLEGVQQFRELQPQRVAKVADLFRLPRTALAA